MVQKCGDHQLSLVVYPIINRVLYTPGDLPTQAWFISSVNFVKPVPQKGWNFQLSILRGVVTGWRLVRNLYLCFFYPFEALCRGNGAALKVNIIFDEFASWWFQIGSFPPKIRGTNSPKAFETTTSNYVSLFLSAWNDVKWWQNMQAIRNPENFEKISMLKIGSLLVSPAKWWGSVGWCCWIA